MNISGNMTAMVSNQLARPSQAQIWGFGLLFVTVISSAAAVGIALMPCLSKRTYNRALIYFIGLGVGTLSGSAIFHLFPEAFRLVEHDKTHSYLIKSFVALCGIYVFFLVDKFIKLFMEWKKVRRSRKEFYKSKKAHSNGTVSEASSYATIPNAGSQRRLSFSDGTLQETLSTGTATSAAQLAPVTVVQLNGSASPEPHTNGACGHDHGAQFIKGKSVVATVAWMIIFGDGLHNFVDGLSIGAAFSESILSGISISVAVMCEEFPHELGDVAILVSAGMTLRQALFYNLLSAATCYIGFIIGVLVGELSEASVYIFAFAAGMFLYISLGNMIPEMNNTMEKAMSKSVRKGLYVVLVQSAGVFTGLSLMFIMAYFGDRITFN